MKRVLQVFILLLIAVSCRIGEDDPLISLKSRNNRLAGTWKLVKMENNTTEVLSFIETNDVNENTTESDVTETTLEKFSDNFLEEKSLREGRIINTSYRWEISGSDTTVGSETVVVVPDVESKIENEFEYLLEIKSDDRYKITKRTKVLREYFVDATKIDAIANPFVRDTIFTNSPKIEVVSEGVWFWRDAHKKKAILVAGEIEGYVNELRNDKMVITNYENEAENNLQDLSFRNDLKSFEQTSDYDKLKTGTVEKTSNSSKRIEFYWEFEKLD